MAIECTGGFAGVTRTTDILPFGAAYTFMMWFRLDGAVTDDDRTYASISVGEAGAGGVDSLRFAQNGTVYALCGNGVTGAQSAAQAITPSAWHHLALVREDASTLWCYLDAVKSATAADLDCSIRAAPDEMWIHEFFGNGFMVGQVKAWDRELTVGEIASEMNREAPVEQLADLYGYWPLEGLVLDDESPNGRDFLQNGEDELFDYPGPNLGGDEDAPLFGVFL
jgi:hypothetical protein